MSGSDFKMNTTLHWSKCNLTYKNDVTIMSLYHVGMKATYLVRLIALKNKFLCVSNGNLNYKNGSPRRCDLAHRSDLRRSNLTHNNDG